MGSIASIISHRNVEYIAGYIAKRTPFFFNRRRLSNGTVGMIGSLEKYIAYVPLISLRSEVKFARFLLLFLFAFKLQRSLLEFQSHYFTGSMGRSTCTSTRQRTHFTSELITSIFNNIKVVCGYLQCLADSVHRDQGSETSNDASSSESLLAPLDFCQGTVIDFLKLV